MTRIFILPAIFGIATLTLYLIIKNAPDWEYDNINVKTNSTSTNSWELPKEFENFTAIAKKFRMYKEKHFFYINLLFCFTYLYKQTFAIPGSFFLNVIAGVLFGLWDGFVLVCILTTIGSTLCYLFSDLCGKQYVYYLFGKPINYLQQQVEHNSHRILPFLLFARMFPISPSWLLNIAAPFLNIPLPIFSFSAFVGLAPYNFVCVQAGYIIKDLHSWNDVLSTTTMMKLCSFALLPLAYAMFTGRKKRQRVHTVIPKEKLFLKTVNIV
uniref:Transmembrane protein 41A n=1 Tax=Strongyloides stercoralis TaxID=6248 RepID=A0A0K0EQV6_STRER